MNNNIDFILFPFSTLSVRLLESLQSWVLKTQKAGLPNSRKKMGGLCLWKDKLSRVLLSASVKKRTHSIFGQSVNFQAEAEESPLVPGFPLTHNFQSMMHPKQPTSIYVHTFPLEKSIWKIYNTNNKEM